MSSVAHGEEVAKWWCIYYVGNDRYVVRYSLDVDQADGLRMSWQLRILPGRSKEAANRRNPLIPSIRRAGQWQGRGVSARVSSGHSDRAILSSSLREPGGSGGAAGGTEVGDEEGEGGSGVRWSSILRLWESTLPQGSFDRNSKLDIWRTG